MKKLIIILIVTLGAVYILLSIVSPKGEYAAERLFYKATKKYEKVKINPDVAPPGLVRSVEKDLENLIERYPNTRPGKLAHITLSEIYSSTKKYDSAIKTLDKFISTEDKEIALLSRAHFLKALIYQMDNKWNKALDEFNLLKEKYYNTPLGLQVPLYIAQYYKNNEKPLKAAEEFNNAAIFYKDLEEKNRGNMLGYSSASFLIQAYMNQEKYLEAGKMVEETITNYPTAMVLIQQLPYVELIYVKTLNMPDKARDIYKDILEKTNDAKLKEFLENKISELEKKD